MATSNIHIICGTCGCATMLRWSYMVDEFDIKNNTPVINCGNCGTNHYLCEFMEKDDRE